MSAAAACACAFHWSVPDMDELTPSDLEAWATLAREVMRG